MQELQLLLFPFAILPIPIRFVWSYVPIPIRFVSAYKKWSWYNSLVPYKEKARALTIELEMKAPQKTRSGHPRLEAEKIGSLFSQP